MVNATPTAMTISIKYCTGCSRQSRIPKIPVTPVPFAPRCTIDAYSAPHPPESKTGSAVSPGIYSMPVTIPLLACFFDESSQTDKLESFVSVFGRRFYGLPETTEKIIIEKKSWEVPEIIDGAVPLCAGTVLSWTVRDGGKNE